MREMLLELAAHLQEQPLTLPLATDLVVRWLVQCDRGEKLTEDQNSMHVVGDAICAALHMHDVPIPSLTELNDSRLRARLFLCDGAISDFSVRALQDFLCNLQAEFNTLYELTEQGYMCHVDMTTMLLMVMKRLGYWLRHDFQPPDGDDSLRDVADPDAGGWLRLRPAVSRSMLDAVHALLSFHRLLVMAEPLPSTTHTHELHPAHLEASMEFWWELSSVADCPVGGITQYKNNFQYLFHSVSQVIYYHYPAYNRRMQKTFAEIEAGVAGPLHVLPLLLQVAPEIPVLYEHTGAGSLSACSQAPFSWCVFGQFALLVQRSGKTFCAQDINTLLHHALTS